MADTAIFAATVPIITTLGALVVWWAAATPRLALAALFGSLIVGQIIRIPLPGQGGGVLVSDIAVLLVLIAAAAQFCLQRKLHQISNNYQLPITNYSLLVTLFLVWSLFTLVVHMPTLGFEASIISLAYWLRLAAHLLLLPALLVLFRDTRVRQFTHRAFTIAIAVLAVIGFIQLAVVPNLEGFMGWDPHMGRLVSTWLDPNFMGLFFVLAAIYAGLHKKYKLFALVLAAIALTQSRSSLAAMGIVALVFSPAVLLHFLARSKQSTRSAMQAIAVGGMIIVSIIIGALVLGSRLPATFIDDPTVYIRTTALEQTWHALAADTALLGKGYNAYQFAAQREGLISSFDIHSRAGSDSSLLTLWVTTGIFGIVLFLLPWAYAAMVAWHSAWHARQVAFLVVPTALLAVLLHAQVVNSLLYGHILITLAVIGALTFGLRASHA